MANKTSNASIFRGVAGAAAALLLIAAGFFYLQATSRTDSGGGGAAMSLVAAAQSLPGYAAAALDGDATALRSLQDATSRIQSGRRGAAGLPGSNGDWQRLEDGAVAIANRAPAIDALAAAIASADAATTPLISGAEQLLGVSAATEELQGWQRTASGLPAALRALPGASDSGQALQGISAQVAAMREVANALSGGASGLDVVALSAADQESLLAPLDDDLASVEAAISTLAGNADGLAGLGADVAGLRAAASALYDAAASAGPGGGGGLPGPLAEPMIPIVLVVIAVLLIGALVLLHSKSAVFERTAGEQAEQNERNQQAILRLLNELDSLADGDLSVEATVTEDITGAIADSINYAIEKLRELVATIDRTSIMVDSAAKQTENTATHMARAADNQSREIAAATESIVSMAASIEEVSGNAERSSDVARHSVDVAHKGGEAVRRTIDGMNTIRETIQDTSKRIKRLGESSQEIGNIVELINDIAEQTNILALNASIQASMAGEAGRGFAVVADEVQRLAERSTNATKQIEVLVRTIQADTNEAVVSMERSTTDVVGGALLAENAGAALDEIEQVSNQIANLVQNISGSARQQASSAADVTRRTTKLKEIGEQTGKATTATAASISKLSNLASQLRATVAGFTLPSSALEASPIGAAQPAEKPAPEPTLRAVEDKAAGQG